MKLKDIEGTFEHVKIKTPKGVVGYWKSQWNKGVWLTNGKTNQIYPQFVDNLKDCLEWEITDEKANCDIKTNFEDIDNCKGD